MKTVVTGGCGFIGSHLVNALVDCGHEVIVIDLKSKPIAIERNPQATYYLRDIRNYSSILPIFHAVGCVFHLAAESRIKASIDSPVATTEHNVLGTTNVLECCRQHGVKRFVNSSTSAIYGLTDQFPTSESTPTDCLNPYAATKLAAEKMVRCYSSLYDLETCNLRYFNVFGEDSPVTGPYSLVTGIFLQQKAAGKPLTVVGDGGAKRDFVYVGDVVAANINAMGVTTTGGMKGESYNIGSGRNISVLDVAKLVSDNIVFVDPRQGEAKTTLADVSFAKQMLGWEPQTFLENWLPTQFT
jgi:UDP-glucose 4-epimerase